MTQLSIHSPIGDLTISEENDKLLSLDWGWSPFQKKTPLLMEAKKLLDYYFDGDNPKFDLPLNPQGTPYQKKVWQEISIIPYGKFLTYSNISEKIDSHPRSIGMACGKNPLPILIPCHRVIGKKEQLTGFSAGGGIETKKFLLQLEVPNVYFNIFN